MSLALEMELRKLRLAAGEVALRHPVGSPTYDRALAITSGLKSRIDAASTLTPAEAILAVRTAREQIEKIVAGRE